MDYLILLTCFSYSVKRLWDIIFLCKLILFLDTCYVSLSSFFCGLCTNVLLPHACNLFLCLPLYFKLVLQRLVVYMLPSVWFFWGGNIYMYIWSAETPFLPFIPFCTGKNQLYISPSDFIRSHTDSQTNIKIQCEAPWVSGKLLCIPYVEDLLYSIWKIRMCFFLVRFGQRRQKGNQSYRRSRFACESFYGDEIKAQREFFIPSSSMFPVSIKSLDT